MGMNSGPIWALALAIVLLTLLAYVAYIEEFRRETGDDS